MMTGYEKLLRILTQTGEEKAEATANYLEELVNSITWKNPRLKPSLEEIRDSAKWMADLFATFPEKDAERLDMRSIGYLTTLLNSYLRSIGGWTAGDVSLGAKM